MSRRRDALRERLAGSALPGPAAAVILRVLREARLWASETEEVAEELASHFLEGLERGRTLESLLSDFGRPSVAASLIGRGRRRLRPASWHALAGTARVAAALLLLLLGAYAVSFARLHAGSPAAAAGRTRGVASVPWRLAALRSWSLEEPALLSRRRSAAALLEEARRAAARGRPSHAAAALLSALERTEQIRQEPGPASDLAALHLEAEAVREAGRLFARGGAPGAAESAGLEERLRRLDLGRRRFPAEQLRSAFGRLADAMYTERHGRLTAEGLRLFQTWKGKLRPGVAAMLLEPAYFSRPAARRQIDQALDRLLAAADAEHSGREPGAFRREELRLLDSAWTRLRYLPLEIPIAHIEARLAAERALARGLRLAFAAREPSAQAGPASLRPPPSRRLEPCDLSSRRS